MSSFELPNEFFYSPQCQLMAHIKVGSKGFKDLQFLISIDVFP